MADSGATAPPAGGLPSGSDKPPKPPNPVWRMMGLPNFRFKLPSRNWMIFLSITGSWTAAVTYDRREKKRIQQKWARVVEHIAQEPLDTQQLPRKLTVFIAAPPADGLVAARDHFHEYIKPILVAAALDWDAIEGRREGDVRAGLAERIRKLRKKRGETTTEPIEEGVQELLETTRQKSGVREWAGPGGDIVVGRHTWKEYVRGLHEGWLGPVDTPSPAETAEGAPVANLPAPEATLESRDVTVEAPESLLKDDASPPPDDASPKAIFDSPPPETDKAEEAKEEEKKAKKKTQPPPFITTAGYEDATLSRNCPQAIGPAAVIPQEHLLGFLNFPIRMYRFLNRRHVADVIGKETAAAVLGVYRPFRTAGEESTESSDSDSSAAWEQQRVLDYEEPDWHKSARTRNEDDERERIWLDDMVVDARIGDRMRRFALERQVEERANSIPLPDAKPWFSAWRPKKKLKGAWEGLENEEE